MEDLLTTVLAKAAVVLMEALVARLLQGLMSPRPAGTAVSR